MSEGATSADDFVSGLFKAPEPKVLEVENETKSEGESGTPNEASLEEKKSADAPEVGALCNESDVENVEEVEEKVDEAKRQMDVDAIRFQAAVFEDNMKKREIENAKRAREEEITKLELQWMRTLMIPRLRLKRGKKLARRSQLMMAMSSMLFSLTMLSLCKHFFSSTDQKKCWKRGPDPARRQHNSSSHCFILGLK